MFKTRLDGVEYNEPIGLNSLSERIYFNEELSMYLNKLEGDVLWVGDGYNYLRDLFNNDICVLVDIEIEDTRSDITYSGVIFINDIKWDLSKRTAECKIISDKYIQSIDNNRGIKVQIGVDKTKNLIDRVSLVQTDITLPDDTGTTHVTRYGYRLFDVFTELLEFITDGELTFVSDYFDPSNGGDASYSVIMTGEEVRLGAHDTTPLVSWNDFFSDVNKLHNIAGVIEGDTLRVEPKSYFRQQGSTVVLSGINTVTQENNREQFYASVKFGSAKVADGYGYLIRLSYNGFQKEQFYLEGRCNINNELNLELQTLITDTNIIQDIQPVSNGGSNNEDFDSDVVIIHCNSTNTAYVTISPLSTDYYYNDYYTNKDCSKRWAETYPFSIIQLLETENPLVRATLTSDQTNSTSPTSAYFSPNDDTTPPNFDAGTYWNIGNILVMPTFNTNVGYFEAPSDMVVSFMCNFYITGFYYRTQLWHVDAFGDIMTVPYTIDTNPQSNIQSLYWYVNNRHILGGTTFYMPSGSRVYVKGGADTIHSGGTFEALQTGAYGGIYELINQNNAFVSKVDFQYPIDSQSWSSIRNDKFKRIEGTYVDGGFSGFILDATRNIDTGDADIKTYQRKKEVDG